MGALVTLPDPNDPLQRLSRLAANPANAIAPNLVPFLQKSLSAIAGNGAGLGNLPAVQGVGPGFGLKAIPTPNAGGPQLVAPRLQALPSQPPPDLSKVPNLGGNGPLPDLGPVAPAANVARQASDPAMRLNTDQQELTRLNQTGSGVSQIKEPWLRGFARIGDTLLDTVAPHLAQYTPGTQLHHQMLLGQAQQRIGQDQGELDDASKLQEQRAQTTLLDAQPQLKQMAAENTALKTQGQLQHWDAQNQRYGDQTSANLAEHGYKADEQGNLVPMKYEEMSPQMQAIEDLKHAQTEQSDASAALKKAQNDPSSPAYRLAQQRLVVAQQNANTAVGRLGLSREQYNMHAYGVGADGQALPGTMLLSDGTPVGTANAANVRPTATQRDAAGRADTADALRQSILQQLQNPEVRNAFGPVSGRLTQQQIKAGFASPAVAKAYNDMVSYGAFQAGMHPVRGIGALEYFDKVNGGLAQTPEQLEGKLASGQSVMRDVHATGTPRVASGAAASRPGGSAAARGPQPGPVTGPTATPDTHTFSASAWQAANPKGNVNAAINAAKAQNYQVVK